MPVCSVCGLVTTGSTPYVVHRSARRIRPVRILHGRSRLLAKLEPVLNDPSIFQLVSSFLNLSILDEDGRDWSAEAGVPAVGLLASVLLNFYLDYFDRTFINRFPHLPFVRYIHEIIVAVPLNLNNQERLSFE